jgi:glycosyltransferase involved in cell wall biosynthesis
MVPVLFIAYHFPPVGGAGVQRSHKFVRYLPNEGFLPIVVTGPGPAGDRWSPRESGSPTQFRPEVQVLRAAGPIPQTNGRWAGKLNRWLAKSDGFSEWWIRAAGEAADRSVNGAKLIFATMSPFSTAQLAYQVAQRHRIPWIADLRDPWALDEMQIYPSALHRRIEVSRMKRSLSAADGIVMNTPEATSALREAFPSLGQKPVTTITNGYDEADFGAPLPSRSDGKFRIVHSGYLHTEMGIQVQKRRRLYELLGGMESGVDILTRSHVILLKALEQWVAHRPEIGQDLEVVFAGVATDQDKSVAEKTSVAGSIRFAGYLSHADSVNLIRTADLLFLPMHNLPAGKRSRIVPGKTYEYMATGRPILAAVPDGDARDFLQQSGTALLCRPDDIDGMVRHLAHIYSAWKKGVAVVTPNWEFIRSFERSRLTQKLAAFFEQVLQAA